MTAHKTALVNIDSAGGLITGTNPGGSGLQDFVKIDGHFAAVVGDAVASHGEDDHAAAVMAEGSSFVTIGGIPACINGNKASCGDSAVATGFVTISE